MNFLLELAGIRFRFNSDCDIMVEESIAPFFIDHEVSDVNIDVVHGFTDAPCPSTPMLGEDVLMEYYQERDNLLCLTKGGRGTHLSCCVCDAQLRQLTCYLNFKSGASADTLGNLLRMIPLRRILLDRGVLFFHASQIAIGEIGILFTAPSQTGKTTQAKLWKQHRGARILCNDRTLTDGCHTWGFPVDGSEPVGSSEQCRLGAIVLLEQAQENAVVRLQVRKAIPRLMSQLVTDTWDPHSASAALELLLELMARTPVYLLRCRPDAGAVECLEQQFYKDGVISDE